MTLNAEPSTRKLFDLDRCNGMHRILIAVAILLSACESAPAPGSAAAQTATQLRVLSFNIYAGKDEADQPNLERVAALLDSLAIDIALLQEVDRETERSGFVDQLAELERRTGMTPRFGKIVDYQAGEFGIAILSRLPIVASTVVPLTVEPPEVRASGSSEPRVALHVVVETAAGPLHVLNTHLHAAAVATYRRQELVGLMARAGREVPRDAHLVLGGDLNARPESDEITAIGLALRDAWAECGEGAGETYPASAPDRRIDYLYIRTGECSGARVLESLASDHRPLLLLLELP